MSVRWAAASALGKFGPEAWSAATALTEALEDEDLSVRRAAEEALESIEAE
jgi:HEAT repeat protein